MNIVKVSHSRNITEMNPNKQRHPQCGCSCRIKRTQVILAADKISLLVIYQYHGNDDMTLFKTRDSSKIIYPPTIACADYPDQDLDITDDDHLVANDCILHGV